MLNFNQTLKGLDNTEVLDASGSPVTLGKLLSSQLANANKGDALKFFTWATKLYNSEELELDLSDTQTLKEFIKSSDSLTILAKAQLLIVFN
jgi:hypothetical protein